MRGDATPPETALVMNTATPSDDLRSWQEALAAARGDAAARAVFWLHHVRRIHAWLWLRWRHGTLRSSIDDATQEVYLECFRPGGAFAHFDPARAHHGVLPFLHAVVRNVAQRFERSRRRERAHQIDYAVEHTTFADAPLTTSGDATIDRERLAAALDHLDDGDPEPGGPHSLRTFVRLHFEEGRPVREIARAWQAPPTLVHELRRRACRRLRACLRRIGAPRDQPAR